MTLKTHLEVQIWALNKPTGDVGPCDSFDPQCPNRATHKLEVGVGTVRITTYVCDEHRDELMRETDHA